MKEFFKKKIAYIKAHPRVDIAFLVIGLAIFVTIALINVGRASIWFDEAFSAYIIQFNFLEIAQFTATDVHPPLYYWILKIWELLFGSSDSALRSLSIFFGTGVIITAFALTRKLFGRLIAGVATLFLVLSPTIIRYSDEARMYTMAALIVFAATYVLMKALETNQRRWYVIYGILVGLGMWTHYFTALIWIAHWVWRAVTIRQSTTKPKLFWKKFFTKNWIIAHVVAVGIFLPWLPFMVVQLGTIQGYGFWIGSIGIDTITNYFTNIFYYLEHDQAIGWLGILLIAVLTTLVVLMVRTLKTLPRADKQKYFLVLALSFVPVVLLLLTSLPPLQPSFVERYLVPAIIGFSIFMAITLVVGTRKWRPIFRILPILIISGMMIFGITNVYKYGNYNKNSDTHTLTRELIEQVVAKAKPGEPIVSNSPWLFYEAIAYNSDDNPIYFIDANNQYVFGSLDMLKAKDLHKIKDVNAFEKQHPVIWYIGTTQDTDVPPYEPTWKKLQTIALSDELSGKTEYRATEYRVSGE